MQTAGAIQTTIGTEMNGKIRDPKSEYYGISAEKCFVNNSCPCCTCSCCALCLMILWIIVGIIGIWSAYTVLDWTSNDELYNGPCIRNGKSYDDCCIGNQGLLRVEIVGINCDEIETAYTIALVDQSC